ncbi:T9SS type A sorting domain-containing protein [Adhaeribacter sp. BT258]|uniref:T9SS type A sorting domain-containing protein n=1 Tax=Adhaeribacter terrigena TaxID=2793070 RepID=A0ABS1C387_9BACT|nr:T9SS type A sorting domain-containing protein [Adhaeribacter terrigena]MBK0403861.1 T9SS type A sorting domain-containing protein [Adhaeribacter terrigena]
MKTKSIFWISFLAGLLFLFAQAVYAQETTTKTKVKTETVKTKTETKTETLASEPESRVETLSGINLFPNRQTGNFSLRFTQALKDTANMELKNNAGKVLYALALTPEEAPMAKPVDVGKLNAGIYLIEVKSANTVYWKKVRIRK